MTQNSNNQIRLRRNSSAVAAQATSWSPVVAGMPGANLSGYCLNSISAHLHTNGGLTIEGRTTEPKSSGIFSDLRQLKI